MEKEGETLNKENIMLLNQLVKTLEEVGAKLEEFYDKKDIENFNKTKKFILGIQEKISEVVT